MAITIRPLQRDDETDWRRLWAGYIDFYKAVLSPRISDGTWARLMADDPGFFALVAEIDGQVAGFSHCVVHPGTWSLAPVCYLQDLYTDPGFRAQGVGRTLIEAVLERGRNAGWMRVYWRTADDNTAAQSVYDRVAKRTAWLTYEHNF